MRALFVLACGPLFACSAGSPIRSGPIGGDGGAPSSSDASSALPDAKSAAADDAGGGDGGGGGGGPMQTATEKLCEKVVVECENTYYKDTADCVKQALDYWGTCKERIDALNTYNECIGELPCETIGQSYNPSTTPCASLYTDLKATKCP